MFLWLVATRVQGDIRKLWHILKGILLFFICSTVETVAFVVSTEDALYIVWVSDLMGAIRLSQIEQQWAHMERIGVL